MTHNNKFKIGDRVKYTWICPNTGTLFTYNVTIIQVEYFKVRVRSIVEGFEPTWVHEGTCEHITENTPIEKLAKKIDNVNLIKRLLKYT